MKIVISGASGIGKTTLGQKLAGHLDCEYIPDVTDKILEDRGFKSWLECKSKDLEKEIRMETLKEKISLEKKCKDFVSDKGVIDYLAYWIVNCSAFANEQENSFF